MTNLPEVLSILALVLWVLSIGAVVFILYRFQKEAQKLAQEQLKNKDLEIEKMVKSSTLDQLVDLNNKDHKS